MITTGNKSSIGEDLKAGATFAVLGPAIDWLTKAKAVTKATKGELGITLASDHAAKQYSARVGAMGSGQFVGWTTDNAFQKLLGEGKSEAAAGAEKAAGAEASAGATGAAEKKGAVGTVEDLSHKELTASTRPVDKSKLDPLLHKLQLGEQMILQSIALRHYGLPLDQLPHELQQAVLQRRHELTQEAMFEAQIHNPDLVRQEYIHQLKNQMEANPELAKEVETLKKMFNVDVPQVMADGAIKDAKASTGYTSTAKAAETINTGTAARAEARAPKEITANNFAQHRVDSLQYFRNPTKGAERLDVNGNAIGGRDKRSWAERLKKENYSEFIRTLRKADGDRIIFEDDYHRLLFHFANRDVARSTMEPEVYRAFDEKLLRELKKYKPGMNRATAGHEADRLLNHLQLLVESGRLTKDGNVYKSSAFTGAEATKHQIALHTEVEHQELSFLLTAVKHHPDALRAMQALTGLLKAQNNRVKSIGRPNDWAMYHKVIQDMLVRSVSNGGI